MNGIVCVLKPTGLTSSDAVVSVKRILGTKAVGHLGTLDPFAAGVLPIAVGKSTRLFDYFLNKTKSYRAVVRFGSSSLTLDTDAEEIQSGGRVPQLAEINAVLDRFVGKYMQVPPVISAKVVDGVRAYDLARQGLEVNIPAKEVEIYSLEYVGQHSDTEHVFDVTCKAGTYVRALFRDIAQKLGTTAILSALVRTKCGEWGLADCVTLEELQEKGGSTIHPVTEILSALPRYEVQDRDAKRFLNGVPFAVSEAPCEPFTVWYQSRLYGLGKIQDGKMSVKTFLLDQE